MQIHGWNKTTLLDYPGKLAATLFTGSCNFRCPYCHNKSLVMQPSGQPLIPEDEIFTFLHKRSGILEGVCITGGEPTLQSELPSFIAKIKELDYQVKLDTNGYRPDVLRDLIDRRLIDYIAMDIKSDRKHYASACGLNTLNFHVVETSVDLIRNSGIAYEFRTTVVRELHNQEILEHIGRWLNGCQHYYLQGYRDSADVIEPGFHSYSLSEMQEFKKIISPYIPTAEIRGVA